MRVSLCMIVRNEVEHLEACLLSARGLADEIVVVDTGSTDETKAIAVAAGACVSDFPWRNDFAAARNESIDKATGDWILWMDADDRIPPASHGKLAKLIEGLGSDNAAYLMTVVSVGRDGRPAQQTSHARLFRRDRAIRWDYRAHEQILPALQAAGARLYQTDIVIGHVGYMRSADVDRKLQRNLRLIDLDLERRTLDSHLLICRAGMLVETRRPDEALVTIGLWEGAYGLHGQPVPLRILKARALGMCEDLREALECIQSARQDHPRDAKLMLIEAEILAALGDLASAGERLQDLLAAGGEQAALSVVDCTIADYRARHLLARVLLMQGRAREALGEARQVTESRPGYGPAWLTMAEAAVQCGDVVAFDAACARFATGADAGPAQAVLSAMQLRRTGDPDAALQILGAGPTAHPAIAPIYAGLLFETGVRGADLDGALEQALAYDPFSAEAWLIKHNLDVAFRIAPFGVAPAPLRSRSSTELDGAGG